MEEKAYEEAFRAAMLEAYAPAAEMQRLAAKPVLTQDEVSTLYGVSVSALEKMRAANRGPAYVSLGRKIMYSPAAIQKWLEIQTVQPRNI
jgi:predicted DNA-binding transcriptional regulator AlpA